MCSPSFLHDSVPMPLGGPEQARQGSMQRSSWYGVSETRGECAERV